MLKEAGEGANREAISNFLSRLAEARANRDELKSLLALMRGKQDAQIAAGLKGYADDFARLPDGPKQLAVEAAKDLDQLLADIPDATLNSDWSYLVREIRRDLLVPPAQACEQRGASKHSQDRRCAHVHDRFECDSLRAATGRRRDHRRT
jgi:hypothetical protein